APGLVMDAMTYQGTVVGPVLRSELDAQLTIDLVNNGMMGHSLDLHAGRVAPDEVMRTIPRGEALEYSITTEHAGIWLYHCATMPMSVHLAAGMVGAQIVPPAGLAAADREYVLVPSEHYLVPQGAAGYESATHEGAHPVSAVKIAAAPSAPTVFNRHATQCVHAPLAARAGDPVRARPAPGPDGRARAPVGAGRLALPRHLLPRGGRRVRHGVQGGRVPAAPRDGDPRRGAVAGPGRGAGRFRRAGLRRARHLHGREPRLRGHGARGPGADPRHRLSRRRSG